MEHCVRGVSHPVDVIRSLCRCTNIVLFIGEDFTDDMNFNLGECQGCSISQTLFNTYIKDTESRNSDCI